LSRGSTSLPAARRYIDPRLAQAAANIPLQKEKILPAGLFFSAPEKAVPARARTCRAARPDRRSRVRFPDSFARDQKRVRSLCHAEVWRGKIEAPAHAIPFRFRAS